MEGVAIETSEVAVDFDVSFHARFEAVRPRLLAICCAVVGYDDAEDVAQETYIRARARFGQLRSARSFEAWVVRIALNEARSVARGRARHNVSLGDIDPPAHRRDRDVALVELVDGLPIRQRMAVVLYYGYGYDMGDVARLLGVSRINARTVLFRARRRLRSQWEAIDDQ